MADVTVFPLVLRSPDARAADRPSEVVPFPYSRRRQLVRQHAQVMRDLDACDAEAYIIRVLEDACRELNRIGIECEDCKDEVILDYADAVGKLLHGPSFTLRKDGCAQ